MQRCAPVSQCSAPACCRDTQVRILLALGRTHQAYLVVADAKTAWSFNVNLFEVLRYNGLPCDADELRALCATSAPP